MPNTFRPKRTTCATSRPFRPIWTFWAFSFCMGLCDGYTTFYGPSGQLAGSANTIAGYSTYYDAQGSLAGSSNTIGGYTTFYDSQGDLAGSANNVGGVE